MLASVQTETGGSKQIFFHLGVKLESTAEWKRQEGKHKHKRHVNIRSNQ
jgi:hypothetical protein